MALHLDADRVNGRISVLCQRIGNVLLLGMAAILAELVFNLGTG